MRQRHGRNRATSTYSPPCALCAIILFLSFFLIQDSQGSVENVAITIGVAACTPYGGCPDATQQFGQIIYGAPYAPTYLSPGNATLGQNVTVQVPDAFKGGKVSLNVAHVALEGVSVNTQVTVYGMETY